MDEPNDPISKPIYSIDELICWSREGKNKRSSFIHFDKFINPGSTKTLICHDMMNGYKDDRFDQGTSNFNSFTFFYWKDIDIFIYFSHYFISIPPFVWRVAAHRNNCPILATIIIEDDKNCNQLYRILSENNIDTVIEKLVDICLYYNFDGYLVNFETSIDPVYVQPLLGFIVELRCKLKAEKPNSLVIWYDSINHNGQVHYYNHVCPSNINFFHCSDMFFTNYNWTKNDIEYMKDYIPPQMHEQVLVGVDLFKRHPRETYENFMSKVTHQFKYLHNHKFSVALFAIGYLYEIFGPEEFFRNFKEFWESLSPHNSHAISLFPFKSNFCIGRGQNFYLFGKNVNPKPFSNLSLQQVLPFLENKRDQREIGLVLWDAKHSYEDSYIGGSCFDQSFTFYPNVPNKTMYSITSLYSFDIKLPEIYSIQFVYKTNLQTDLLILGLQLVFSKTKLLIIRNTFKDKNMINKIKKINKSLDVAEFNYDEENDAHFVGGLDYDKSWNRMYFINTDNKDDELKEINLVLIPIMDEISKVIDKQTNSYNLKIGELSIHTLDDFNVDWNSIRIYDINIDQLKVITKSDISISCSLTWKIQIPELYEKSIECIDIFCNNGAEYVFVGRCMAIEYYYANFNLKEIKNNKIFISFQVVFQTGVRNHIENCPRKEINIEN